MTSSNNNKLTLIEYKELYDAMYFSLCLFATKYVNNIELSKDAVQEVFINIWKKEIVFENDLAIKSYLYKSVRNKCLDILKSKEYKLKFNLTEGEYTELESENYFEKEVLIEEVSQIINNAVSTLPQRCKEIMLLSLKGLENSQISEELSLSVNTIKAQKRIAYQKLRPILKETLLGVIVIITT